MDGWELKAFDVALTIIGVLGVYVLNGIKKEITDVKTSMQTLNINLINLDKRVVVLETVQEIKNANALQS